jgi:hypothetical protein
MNKTQYFAPRIRPNLLNEFSEFETPHTWNVVSSTGGITATTSNLMPYDGTNSIKINVVSDGVATKEAVISASSTQMQTTVTKTGDYAISLMLGLDSTQTFVFGLEVWINGIKTEFKSTFTSDMSLRLGQNPLSQTLSLELGDIVDFKFAIESKYSRNLYIDGFKLELIDDNIYLPSAYSVTPYNKNNWHKREDLSNTQNLVATFGNVFGFAGTESKSDVNVSLVSSAGLIVPTKVGSFLRVYYSFDVLVLSGANQYVEIEVNVGGNLVPNGCTLVPIVKADTEMQTVSGSFGIDSYTYLLEQGLQISLRPTNAYTISKRMLIVEETRL